MDRADRSAGKAWPQCEAAVGERMCKCGDRPASECPEPWEPGCDLGNNPDHAKAVRWSRSTDGDLIFDEDFKADALLRIEGDFESRDQRAEYAEHITQSLNQADDRAQLLAHIESLEKRCADLEADVAACRKDGAQHFVRGRDWAQLAGDRFDAIEVLRSQNAELLEALKLAEAGLADIGDADREPGDDLAWCERRAAEPLPAIRAVIAGAERAAKDSEGIRS